VATSEYELRSACRLTSSTSSTFAPLRDIFVASVFDPCSSVAQAPHLLTSSPPHHPAPLSDIRVRILDALGDQAALAVKNAIRDLADGVESSRALRRRGRRGRRRCRLDSRRLDGSRSSVHDTRDERAHARDHRPTSKQSPRFHVMSPFLRFSLRLLLTFWLRTASAPRPHRFTVS